VSWGGGGAGPGRRPPPQRVGKAHRRAIVLQFEAVAPLAPPPGTAPPVPGPDLLLLEGVLQAEHGRAVANLGELTARLAPHALGRGIRGHQVWVLRLELLQLPVKRVELSVAQLGLVEHVVQVLVPADLPAELLELLLDVAR